MAEKRNLIEVLEEYSDVRADIERIHNEIERFIDEKKRIHRTSEMAFERIEEMNTLKKQPIISMQGWNARTEKLQQLTKEADEALKTAIRTMNELDRQIEDAEERLSKDNEKMSAIIEELRIYTVS
jgi:DNA repair exonuclease SbcCD ATPase subunit